MESEFSFKRKNSESKIPKKAIKSLKTIINYDQTIKWNDEAVLYKNLDAPPSLKPPPKVSDLSGVPCSYQDHKTGLRYATVAEYTRLLEMPTELTKYHLNYRGIYQNSMFS